jgi:Fe-S cluster assembly scaffold protein SufB
MQSRGIDEVVAQQLLTKTFITRILNEVNIPSTKDFIENLITDKLRVLTQ